MKNRYFTAPWSKRYSDVRHPLLQVEGDPGFRDKSAKTSGAKDVSHKCELPKAVGGGGGGGGGRGGGPGEAIAYAVHRRVKFH